MEAINEQPLFDRMICHEAGDADWDQLDGLAVHDDQVWKRLAFALRDHGDVVQLVGGAGDAAEAVELPPMRMRTGWTGRLGWLAAAALLFGWFGTEVLGPTATAPPVAVGEPATSELVGELPSLLVGTRPLPEGKGIEVTYVRRLLERRTTQTLYERTSDEWGAPAIVPAVVPTAWTQEL